MNRRMLKQENVHGKPIVDKLRKDVSKTGWTLTDELAEELKRWGNRESSASTSNSAEGMPAAPTNPVAEAGPDLVPCMPTLAQRARQAKRSRLAE